MLIAQIIIFKILEIMLEQSTQLSTTKRDKKGFGSSGLHECQMESLTIIHCQLLRYLYNYMIHSQGNWVMTMIL